MATFGGLALVASLVTAGPAVAGHPGVPTSTVNAGTGSGVRYCVSSYAPDGRVVVRAEQTGSTAAIHTNNRGSGCTGLATVVTCGGAQRVVATGTGADGNPATSTATVGPSAAAGCGPSGHAAGSSSVRSGSSPLSGGEAVLLGVSGAVVVVLAIVGAMALRRRRVAPRP